MAELSVSTSVRVRFPREMLAGLEEWGREHNVSRSKAIRVLCWRALACDWGNWKCNCDGPDQCSGECSG